LNQVVKEKMSIQNPLNIGLETIVTRTQEILFDRIGQEVVMINLEAGRYFAMDEIAAEIWERIETPARVANLCAALVDKYDVTQAICQQDAFVFLGRLAEKNLLSIQE